MTLKLTFISSLFDCVANKQAQKSAKRLLLSTFSLDQLRKYGIKEKDIDNLR